MKPFIYQTKSESLIVHEYFEYIDPQNCTNIKFKPY